MKLLKSLFCAVVAILCAINISASPIDNLLERIDVGASKRIESEVVDSEVDFFELDQLGDKIVVRGNNYISIATGINWYLKYYANIHLSWNSMSASLPETLPRIDTPVRIESSVKYRYNLNFCTLSYSMAFWDKERWEREIDWMALHGINLVLTTIGSEGVWFNVLKELGYSKKEIDNFVAGPAFTAWWLMNNLENWGGPNFKRRYKRDIELQQFIVKRMREFGIEPVFPGYCGMLPSNAKEKLNVNATDMGMWCGYQRPSFVLPNDSNFNHIAKLYYREQSKLFGSANFYAMDPFHEGGVKKGVNMGAAGNAIMKAMKECNPKSVWIIQSWQENPDENMIDGLNKGDLLILDLHSESVPKWKEKSVNSPDVYGYGKHNWVYCMLLNFGANVGLHGKADAVINGFYDAKESSLYGSNLCGIGMTPEGIENNPVMFELLLELAWRKTKFDKGHWIEDYVTARYGSKDSTLIEAWKILINTIYNAPKENRQQGCRESIFCATPNLYVKDVSTWANSEDYYNGASIIEAAALMWSVAERYRGNNNFEYDFTDILRQAVSEKGRFVLKDISVAFEDKNLPLFNEKCNEFLNLILAQDRVLGCRSEFMLGKWIKSANDIAFGKREKQLYEWNAKTQITTWGNRNAAIEGGLKDYAHKEWNGILKGLYYNRWKLYFDAIKQNLDLNGTLSIDWYEFDANWINSKERYPSEALENIIDVAKDVIPEHLILQKRN